MDNTYVFVFPTTLEPCEAAQMGKTAVKDLPVNGRFQGGLSPNGPWGNNITGNEWATCGEPVYFIAGLNNATANSTYEFDVHFQKVSNGNGLAFFVNPVFYSISGATHNSTTGPVDSSGYHVLTTTLTTGAQSGQFMVVYVVDVVCTGEPNGTIHAYANPQEVPVDVKRADDTKVNTNELSWDTVNGVCVNEVVPSITVFFPAKKVKVMVGENKHNGKTELTSGTPHVLEPGTYYLTVEVKSGIGWGTGWHDTGEDDGIEWDWKNFNGKYRKFTVTDTPCPEPELQITKNLTTPSNGIAQPGSTIQFEVIVENDGDGNASNVSFTDSMDLTLTLLDWNPLPDGCGWDSGKILCGPFDVPADNHRSFVFEAQVPSDGTVCSNNWLVNTASLTFDGNGGSVSSQGGDVSPSYVVPDPNTDSAKVKIECAPGIKIEKSGPGKVSPGQQYTYAITVTNTGNTSLSGYTVTDQLDTAYISFVSSADGACTESEGTVGLITCAVSTLTPSAQNGPTSQTFSITVEVTRDLTTQQCDDGEFYNQASVARIMVPTGNPEMSAQYSSDPSDPSKKVWSEIKNCNPNVSIEKGDDISAPGAEPGGFITYTITVENTGDVNLQNIKVQDKIANGLTHVSTSGDADCTLTQSNTLVDCTIAELAVEGTAEIIIKVQTSSNPSVLQCENGFENTARIISHSHRSTNKSPIESNKVVTNLNCDPEIEVTKSDNVQNRVKPETPFTYTIKVKNTGNIPLTNAVLDDPLPSDLTFVGWVNDAGITCDDSVNCTIGNLGVDEEIEISFQVAFNSDLSNNVCDNGVKNIATATAKSNGGDVTHNDHETTKPNCKPSVELTKTADSGTVEPGEFMVFEIVFTNTGNIDVKNATITDSLPALPGSATWEVTHEGDSAAFPFAVENLKPTESITLIARAQVPAELNLDDNVNPWCGLWQNTAKASGKYSTNTTFWKQASDEIQVNCTGLLIQKSVSGDLDGDNVAPGGSLTYTISVENMGNTDVYDVTVTDLVDLRLNVENASVDGVDCGFVEAVGGTLVTCVIEELAENSIANITIDVTVIAQPTLEQCGEVENVASITEFALGNTQLPEVYGATGVQIPQGLPIESNPVAVNIDCTPDLDLQKTAESESVAPGQDIVFTIAATNTGSGAVENQTIVDTLPAGLADLEWTFDVNPDDTDAACDLENGVLTCENVSLDQYTGSFEITLTAGTDAQNPVCGVYTNTAAMGELEDEAMVDIECAPDYTVLKTSAVETTTIALGDTISYTITVTNTGNQPLSGIMLGDEFTGEGNLVWADGFDPESPLPEIAVGASLELSATYTILQADVDAGFVENCAYLTWESDDETTLDRESCVDDDITQNPGMQMEKTSTISEDTDVLMLNNIITYTFTVTNTGNVTLNDIDVTDRIEEVVFTGGLHTIDSLAPGISVDLMATYQVTQDDVDEGMIVNCADVTAITPGGVTLEADDCDTRLVNQVIALELLSAAECPGELTESALTAGVEVVYELTVSNVGTVSVSNVEIQASREGTFDAPFPTTFAPNQSETRIWTTMVSRADLIGDEFIMEFSVNGDGPLGASSMLASMTAMQDVGDSVTARIVFDCPIGDDTKPDKPMAVTELPRSGSGQVDSIASVLWVAATLGVIALGTGAMGIRQYIRR